MTKTFCDKCGQPADLYSRLERKVYLPEVMPSTHPDDGPEGVTFFHPAPTWRDNDTPDLCAACYVGLLLVVLNQHRCRLGLLHLIESGRPHDVETPR